MHALCLSPRDVLRTDEFELFTVERFVLNYEADLVNEGERRFLIFELVSGFDFAFEDEKRLS